MTAGAKQPVFAEDEALKGLRAIRDVHHLVAIWPHGGRDLEGTRADLSDDLGADFALMWIRDKNESGFNVYFHANPLRDTFRGIKGKKDDVVAGTHAQLDLDPPQDPGLSYEKSREAVRFTLRRIQQDHPPSVVIDSGNGFNILWQLAVPLDAQTYEDLNAQMNWAFNAKGTHNIDRILKVPGTVAYSNAAKIARGYPGTSQARLVSTAKGLVDFSILPSRAGSPGAGGGASTTVTKDLMIPYPDAVPQSEKAHLRRVLKAHPKLLATLTPGAYSDKSAAGVALARECIVAGVDRLGFAAIVFMADKSDFHTHVEGKHNLPSERARALGRAWQTAEGAHAQDEFGTIQSPGAVPPKKAPPMDPAKAGALLMPQTDLMQQTFTKSRSYVENLTMEGVRVFAGAQKTGKSWLLMQEAQAIAEGQGSFLGLKVNRARVLYCAFEDGPRRTQERLKLLNAQPNPDLRYWMDAMSGKDAHLEAMVQMYQVFPFEVVIVDTLKWWLGPVAAGRTGTAYDQSVEDFMPLVKFAQSKNIAMVMSTHMKKDKRGVDDWQDLITGSLGGLATGSAITLLDRKRGTDDAILHRSGRDFDEEDDIALHWAGVPNGWELHTQSAAVVGAKSRSQSGSARSKILAVLAEQGPKTKKDLGFLCNVDRTGLYKAIKKLEEEGLVRVETVSRSALLEEQVVSLA